MQIFITDECYRNLIDMSDDDALDKSFHPYLDVSIKHGKTINAPTGNNFLNINPPSDLLFKQEWHQIQQQTFPNFSDLDQLNDEQRQTMQRKLLLAMKEVMSVMGLMSPAQQQARLIELESDLSKEK